MSFQRARLGWAFFASCAPLATACSIFTSLNGLTGGSADAGLDAASAGDDGGVDAFDGSVVGASDAASDAPGVPSDAVAPISCGDAGIVCDGACIDPTSDPLNCNGCGNVCASGICGATLAASMASLPSGWMFNGSATYNSFAPSAELTLPGVLDQAGTFVYANPVQVDAMDVQFEFRIGLNGGTRSDGMGFMLEQSGPSAVGGTGGSLGMAGLSGFGVELDIFDNDVCGDTSNNHVGVDDLTICNAGAGTPTSLAEVDLATATLDLGDAHWHAADIAIASGAVTLTIDGTVLLTSVPLTGLNAGAPYYLGFAGATGGLVAGDAGGGYRQEVKDVVIAFPTARCL